MGLIAEILTKVDTVTLNYTAQSYQTIVAKHSTELHLMLVLYIALYGLAVLQGIIPGTIREMAKHILKAFIVFELATNWGMFTTFFYDVFTTGPDDLTAALTNGVKPSEQLGSIFDAGMNCATKIYNKAGTFDFGIVLTALLVSLGTIFMTGFALFLIILAKLGLAILLSIAPLFIALALWKGTQGIFQSWVNYLINFALIPVITYGLLALVLLIMEEAVKNIELAGEAVQMDDVIPYLLTGSIAGLLFAQVNRIASSLGSGMALSTMAAFSRYINRPVSTIASKTGATVKKKVKPKASEATKKLYQSAKSKVIQPIQRMRSQNSRSNLGQRSNPRTNRNHSTMNRNKRT